MDLVEKAAQRLAQLQKAGVDVPTPEVSAGAQVPPARPGAEPIPTPERFAQALERTQATDARATATAPAKAVANVSPAHAPRATAQAGPRSKMVHIDLEALAAAGFVTPHAQRSQVADEFRVIKRPIIRNAREKTGARAERANLVMVTSAIPSEGKSFVALNLAMSIALEVDSTVLLVDADVANPCLMKMTHLSPSIQGPARFAYQSRHPTPRRFAQNERR